MPLDVGTNTWATVAEANTYLEYRAGASVWFTLPDAPAQSGADSKETYLATAYYYLINDASFELSSSLTDEAVKNAQIETAFFLLQYIKEYEKREALQASGVTEFQYSKWREKLIGQVKLPERITGMLSLYSTGNDKVNLGGQEYC